MKRPPHWRRPAAQHARRVADQVAMFRHAERMERVEQGESLSEENGPADAEEKPP